MRAAREEMAALADQRLDATTQRTILDNESMAGGARACGSWHCCRPAAAGTACGPAGSAWWRAERSARHSGCDGGVPLAANPAPCLAPCPAGTAAELQYQGRYVQGLLSRNTALQAEAEEQRLALDISRAGEEELARKGLACERVADSLVSWGVAERCLRQLAG